MAEEKEKKEALAERENEEQASGEEASETGPKGDKQEVSPENEISPAPTGSKKWILLSVLGLILAISGLGIKFAPDFLNKKQDSMIPLIDINEDNLSEEVLSPFFIPPSTEFSRGAIRIDLSVIWDGLASIRFNKQELKIRGLLLSYITKLSEETKDLNSKSSFLEEEMSRLFRESLGVRDLVIKIKEIRYL
jgi:hypothetical protein